MATTKTIQPTGQTITIPALPDAPDASVFSDGIGKITDAVNTLNSNITASAYETFSSDDSIKAKILPQIKIIL